MEMSQNLLMLLFFTLYLLAPLLHANIQDERKPYIVYMGDLPRHAISAAEEHHKLLMAAIGDEAKAREAKIHSYGKSFNAFAARLLPNEVEKLLGEEGVVSVFANTINKLHTTRSWDFLGMTETIIRRTKSESNIIVGMMDTGIYVDSVSFNDYGYGPPPAKWKGECVTGGNFTGCNKKVIGARYYNLENGDPQSEDEQSPADTDGHGTHTSSTVAGVAVSGASLYGIANGTARGGVPSARIAMYKVCWENSGCSDMDLLAGFDDAIADGVDIISTSIGGWPRSFFEDPIAIGSFHAMKKGILTSCSSGNDGPTLATVENVAPWIMTVAASTIDRRFITPIKLGNGTKAAGVSINTFSSNKMYPLTTGDLASNVTGDSYGNASACDYGTLGMDKVKGKIIYCVGSYGQDYFIKQLKGVGAIMSISEGTDTAFTTLIPATNVNLIDANKINQYINTTKNPQAVIYKTRTVKVGAPALASFSSRGPQPVSKNILKPDLAAPGLDILAAYSKLTTVTGEPDDTRISSFNIISGTSMACPHASAAAAYVKSFHPDWSPAAIKSALMTTATPMKMKDDYTDLGAGSGQINPRRAFSPGLIYDISMSSYLRFLCKEGYNSTTIGMLLGGKKKYNCSDFKPAQGTDGLNYPSMHKQLESASSDISAVFHRTVTNVGYKNSVYKATVTSPGELSIVVVPDTLTFTEVHQKQSFKVIVKGSPMKTDTFILAALLEWNDSKHSVKSPIVICKQPF